jgi:hypothetical protein
MYFRTRLVGKKRLRKGSVPSFGPTGFFLFFFFPAVFREKKERVQPSVYIPVSKIETECLMAWRTSCTVQNTTSMKHSQHSQQAMPQPPATNKQQVTTTQLKRATSLLQSQISSTLLPPTTSQSICLCSLLSAVRQWLRALPSLWLARQSVRALQSRKCCCISVCL